MNLIFEVLNGFLVNIFHFTGDWGIAIVMLTVLVRIALLPISMKQKFSVTKQQKLSNEIAKVKEKYKSNNEKLQQELQKYYKESAKGMFGCLITLLQLPIISSLYWVIMKMPIDIGTILIPWAVNLKLPDSYFIVPLVYTITMLSPNLLSYISFFKTTTQVPMQKSGIITMTLLSLMITIKAPIAVGLYFITTSVFSLIEEMGYRVYLRLQTN